MMPNKRMTFFWIGILALFMPTVVACSSQSPAPISGPSTVRGPTIQDPVADTPTSSAEPESTTTAQTGSEPTPLISVAATEKPNVDVEFLMTAALDGLVNQAWASELRQVALRMSRSGNTAYIPLIIDFMRIQFSQGGRTEYGSYLTSLAGEEYDDISKEPRDWGLWAEWLGDHSEVQPPKSYDAWKGEFLSLIDPDMGAFFYDGVKTNIRLEEAVWGGVPKDGIPDLVNPPVVPGNQASYLGAEDRVFGVSINGEHRAYPLRILNPHEMANDVLGGEPIALAY